MTVTRETTAALGTLAFDLARRTRGLLGLLDLDLPTPRPHLEIHVVPNLVGIPTDQIHQLGRRSEPMRRNIAHRHRHIDHPIEIRIAELPTNVDHSRTDSLLAGRNFDVPEASDIQPDHERRTLGEGPVVDQFCDGFRIHGFVRFVRLRCGFRLRN